MAKRKAFLRHLSLITKILCLFLIISLLFIVDIPLAIETLHPIADKPASGDVGSVDHIDGDDSNKPNIDQEPSPTPTPEEKESGSDRPSQGPEDRTPRPDDKGSNEPSRTDHPSQETDPPDGPEDSQEPDDKEGQGPSGLPEDPEDNKEGQGPSSPPEEAGQEQDPGATEEPDKETNKYQLAASQPILQEDLNKLYGRNEDRVAYLTFDDGPTRAHSNAILDILAKEDVKATFFLIGSQVEFYPDIVRRQYREGHGIGNHTYSHVFKDIYRNPNSYTKELRKMEKLLQATLDTDKRFRLTRFPGGSFGDHLAPFRKKVNSEGFVYIDWNCVNGDAESLEKRSPEDLLKRFKDTVNGQTSLIVLMHDSVGKEATVEVLPEIISYLRLKGYRFELLPGSRGF